MRANGRFSSLQKTSVVVIGAGFAGMTAARMLARAGVSVTLLERRPFPGGRAFSFKDQATGQVLDNGQHVLLGCCQETVNLLDDLGLDEAVYFQKSLDLPVFSDGRWTRVYSQPGLPGPLHLLPGLIGYGALTWAERLRALPIAGAMLRANLEHEHLDQQSFASWLATHHQSERAIARLWDLVGVSIANCHADRLSALEAIQAFRLGVLPGSLAVRLGFFTRPLGVLADQYLTHLKRLGVDVQCHATVERLLFDGDRVSGVEVGGRPIAAVGVIAAVPQEALLRLLPPAFCSRSSGSPLGRELPLSGILNWYLRFSEPVYDGTLFAMAGGLSPFVFNRGRLMQAGGREDGRLLAISVSDAPLASQAQRTSALASLREELAKALPLTNSVPLLGQKVVVQPKATFRAGPGQRPCRLGTKSGLSGLWLAGDWTDTGWPASLEGAIRSGMTASRAALVEMSG